MKFSSVVRGACWGLLNHGVSKGGALLAAIILSRSLSTQSYSAFAYLQITIATMASYASVGLVNAATKEAALHSESRNRDSRILGVVALNFIGISVATIALSVPSGIAEPTVGMAPKWAYFAGTGIFSLLLVFGGFLVGARAFRGAMLGSSLATLLFVGSAFLTGASGNVELVSVGYLVAYFVQLIFLVVLVWLKLQWRWTFSGGELLKAIHAIVYFSLPMAAVTCLVATGPWMVARFQVQALGSVDSVGQVSIGLQWFAIAVAVPAQISNSVAAYLFRSGQFIDSLAVSLRRRAIALALCVGACLSLIALLVSSELSKLYGEYQLLPDLLIGWFVVAGAFAGVGSQLGGYLVASGLQRDWLGIVALSTLALVVTAYFMAPIGALGAANAFVVGYFLQCVVAFWVCRLRNLL